MLKIGKLEPLNNTKIEIQKVECCFDGEKFNRLNFEVFGTNQGEKYTLSFCMIKPINSLLELEVGKIVEFYDYINNSDIQIKLNNSFDMEPEVNITIVRLFDTKFLITIHFISNLLSNNETNETIAGVYEIEFNIDDFIN